MPNSNGQSSPISVACAAKADKQVKTEGPLVNVGLVEVIFFQ